MEPRPNLSSRERTHENSLPRNLSQPNIPHHLIASASPSNGLTFHEEEQYSYEDPEDSFPEEGELYHEEGISDSASVVTLYLSQPDAPPLSEEEKRSVVNNKDKEEIIRYVPAGGDDLRGERVKTAPPRPPTEIEELRASKQFINLETATIAGSQLIQRSDGKFNLESPEGQDSCKKFLQELEKLFDSFKAIHVSRAYRNKFSQAYKVLYTEGSLCYLTEILDSAQEGINNFSS